VSDSLIVEADGGSRGNPGPAAYGAVVLDASTGVLLAEAASTIGVASNNVAEYRGLIAGLRAVEAIDPSARLLVRMDSKLVVEQMSGRWRIKHPDMQALAREAKAILPSASVTYEWVPRAQNRAADALVNAALDGRLSATVIGADDPMHPTPPRARAAAKPEPEVMTAGEPTGRTGLASDSLTGPEPAPNRLVGWGPNTSIATTLALLRHGQTQHTIEKRFSGWGGDDPALSDAGREQAAAAATYLSVRGGVDVVVSSPMRRTRETAEAVATAIGADVVVEDDVRECAFGEWDGLTFAEVQERAPADLDRWLGSTATSPPGGESFDEVCERVDHARARLVAAYEGATVLIVTHVTPIKALVRLALDAPARALYRMEVKPASLSTVVWFSDGNASLRSFNETMHLGTG
jgi:probable phosphoglycerate mutase